MADTAIQPMPTALGISQKFIAHEPTFLVLKERLSFSGDDFTIRTAAGADVVRCDGKAMSMSGRKQFVTPNGEHLFTLRMRHFSFPKSWYLEGPSGEKFCEISGRFTFGKAKLDVTFANLAATAAGGPGAGGQAAPVKLEVRGQFFDRSADITWDGRIVAKIRREFMNMREVFGGNQTYGVEVAPGVDLALISAVVVAIDEQRNEK